MKATNLVCDMEFEVEEYIKDEKLIVNIPVTGNIGGEKCSWIKKEDWSDALAVVLVFYYC